MSQYLEYERQIRLCDGSLALEQCTVSNLGEGKQFVNFDVTINGQVKKHHISAGFPPTGIFLDEDFDTHDTMPGWWQPPSMERITRLAEMWEANKSITLTATRNVVTFVIYRENGAMMGQVRSFLSPVGKSVGNPGMLSMYGGLMESDNTASELVREIAEKFGVAVVPEEDMKELGNVYDAENGRHNLVYRSILPYEELLSNTYRGNPMGMVRAILNCEGLGRVSMLFQENLKYAMDNGRITAISIAILRAFPELMPPPAPKPHG